MVCHKVRIYGSRVNAILVKTSSRSLASIPDTYVILRVQINYNVVYFQTSLVQLFVLLLQNLEDVVKIIELIKDVRMCT
jgi:hypothetical protein